MNNSPGVLRWQRPSSRLGWWAVGLALLFIILYIVNVALFMRLPEDLTWRQTLLPFYGIFMLLAGLAAGVVALVAIIRSRERSWLVWLALLPALNVLLLVAGEFLFPH